MQMLLPDIKMKTRKMQNVALRTHSNALLYIKQLCLWFIKVQGINTSIQNSYSVQVPSGYLPVCIMMWVASGANWETTRAPTRLANFLTIICQQQNVMG